MEKWIATILGIVMVLGIFTVVIVGQVGPGINEKGTDVTDHITGTDTGSIVQGN